MCFLTANTSFSGAAYRARSVEFMRNWPHPLEASLNEAPLRGAGFYV
jgi:hypothetical protein